MPFFPVSGLRVLAVGLLLAGMQVSSWQARLMLALLWQVVAVLAGVSPLRFAGSALLLALGSGVWAAWGVEGTVMVSIGGFAFTDQGVQILLARASMLLLWWSAALGCTGVLFARPPARWAHHLAAARAMRVRARMLPWGVLSWRQRLEALAGLVADALRVACICAELRWLRWPRACPEHGSRTS